MKNVKILATVASVSIAGGLPLRLTPRSPIRRCNSRTARAPASPACAATTSPAATVFRAAPAGCSIASSTGAFEPLPEATANGSNFPGAVSSQPYGPTFGNLGGILRVTGTFGPATGQPDRSYIFDSAAAPGQQYTTLVVPGAVNTIAHSQFGNQVVGNYNTTTALGSAFIYDMTSGAFTTNNMPGAASTSAYGIWGDRIAGGYIDPGGGGSVTPISTTRAPACSPSTTRRAAHRHAFRGHHRRRPRRRIQPGRGLDRPARLACLGGACQFAGGRDLDRLTVGASSTSANSIYEDKAIGIFVPGGIASGYIATVAGLYNPVTNTGTLTPTPREQALSATNGDDVVNSGTSLPGRPAARASPRAPSA